MKELTCEGVKYIIPQLCCDGRFGYYRATCQVHDADEVHWYAYVVKPTAIRTMAATRKIHHQRGSSASIEIPRGEWVLVVADTYWFVLRLWARRSPHRGVVEFIPYYDGRPPAVRVDIDHLPSGVSRGECLR